MADRSALFAYVVVALLVYIARKAQQLVRAARHENTTPWWYEIADAINRIRPFRRSL